MAKLRLQGLLSSEQRRLLSKLMLEDMLLCLNKTKAVRSVNIISCDKEVEEIAAQYQVNLLRTGDDRGYSEDAMLGIARLVVDSERPIAIFPADLPQLGVEDVELLASVHEQGISLCPASIDGGTNALVLDADLKLELVFGKDSLQRYQQLATRENIPCQVVRIPGMERDLDRPDDVNWLKQQPGGGKTWRYLQGIDTADLQVKSSKEA